MRLYFILFPRLRQWRNRAQKSDQRVQILRRELAGGVGDDLAHLLGRDVAVGGQPGGEEVAQVRIAPVLEAGRGEIWRDIPGSGQKLALLGCAQEITRCVAFAAMAERGHKVS